MSFLEARKRAGLTQLEVSKSVGVDQSAVSFWDTGKCIPRGPMLVTLANLYECTVDELLKPDKEGE